MCVSTSFSSGFSGDAFGFGFSSGFSGDAFGLGFRRYSSVDSLLDSARKLAVDPCGNLELRMYVSKATVLSARFAAKASVNLCLKSSMSTLAAP